MNNFNLFPRFFMEIDLKKKKVYLDVYKIVYGIPKEELDIIAYVMYKNIGKYSKL